MMYLSVGVAILIRGHAELSVGAIYIFVRRRETIHLGARGEIIECGRREIKRA